MGINAVAEEHLLSYLHSVSKDKPLSIGLILGQYVATKEYIVHFAKTPPFQSGDSKTPQAPIVKKIEDVNEDWIADHAKQASRTLPGGMHVLGIFLTASEDHLNPFAAKLKAVLNKIKKSLDNTKFLNSIQNCNEMLVLSYNTKSHQVSCKVYDTSSTHVKPAEFKFAQNPTKWVQVECKYQIEYVHHIKATESDWPLKKHMTIILDRINEGLTSAIFLFDGDLKDPDDTLDGFGKKKKMSRRDKQVEQEENSKPLEVCILQHCQLKDKCDLFEINESANQIRIVGHIVSKLWLNPKFSVKDTSKAIIEDIMRSLSTRLEMHWDSLTEEEHGEDMNSVHEPPRRVLVQLPNSQIQFSDYLFPGEGPQDAQMSLEEMLDIKIHNENDVQDVEGQADLTDYYNDNLESDGEDVTLKSSVEASRSLYVIGGAVALLVLIISLLIHFMQG